MKKVVQICGLVLAMCFAPMAFAQTSVTLTGVSGQSYDGIYVSPYYANVGGTTVAVVCDDFADESTLGSTWSAQTTSFSNVNSTNTSWGLAGANTSLYGAVGYLTNLVLSAAPGSTAQVIDTFALWAVFDPQGVEQYLASHPITSGSLTTAQLCNAIFGTSGCSSSTALKGSLLYIAENSGFTAAQWGMSVLSGNIPGTSQLCTAEKGNCPAQEFIFLSAAEGGAAAAYLLLAGFCCWGAIFLRSKQRLASTRTVA
jgi:hypothetical protein